MTWELCSGSSQFLVDLWGGCDEKTSWQKAKQHFKDHGYHGEYLLISRSRNGNFRVYNINIPEPADKYTIYSEFNIAKHKATFVHYLEIVIEEDGHVVYAVPSHQEKAIQLACKAKGISRERLNAECPQEYYGDFLNWLLMQSGAISVWETFYQGEANEAQKKKLRELKRFGLYIGEI